MRNLQHLMKKLTCFVLCVATVSFVLVWERLPMTPKFLMRERTTLEETSGACKRNTTYTGDQTTPIVANLSRNTPIKGIPNVTEGAGMEMGATNIQGSIPVTRTTIVRSKPTQALKSSACTAVNCSGAGYPTFVTGDPIGGLGNQLFVYAAIVGLAAHYHCTPVIKPHHYISRVFNITQVSNVTVTNARKIVTGCCRFINLPVAAERQNWTIIDHAQSWKFFENVSNSLLRSLQFREHVLKDARSFLANWTERRSTLVGIHVRRGSFLKHEDGRAVPGPGYIKRAKNFFRTKFTNVQFVVVSNAHKWCKANVTGSDVVYSPFTDTATDLALLSLCDHVIMTVGTFGWWGAWLANGITVYFKDYPRPGSVLFNQTVLEDYYMPHWIAMT